MICKPDLTLNNLQCLICYKTKLEYWSHNYTPYISLCYLYTLLSGDIGFSG